TLSGPVLPVELTSFQSNVQGRTIVLNWATSTEKNSNRFEVQRSSASTGWLTVSSVKASVLSNSTKEYSYSDNKLQSGKYQYRLKMIDNDGTFSYSKVAEAEVSVPKDFQVSQNYPNPFNPTTKIDYQVPVDARVIMEVYNIAGQKVAEVVNQDQSAGYYTVDFGSSYRLSSGVYIYRLTASDKVTGNNFSSIKKMMLLK
ncbi:MAG: T9SS type A sorting domain-containing protein, partial [Ignavibacteriaceae bacterium]|nr:T9SS type A sorting domain-containing protein [Ignavibacteriaceae bacterium]